MLQERIDYFSYIFNLLQDTNSRIEKELIVKEIPNVYKEDFDYIIECLAGKHVFGYRYYKVTPIINQKINDATIKQVLQFLQNPIKEHNLTASNISNYIAMTTFWYDFFEPIVNRTLRLGIGNSLIDKVDTSPMLAKKFENGIPYDPKGYYVTEKLDGNRCIAKYVDGKWHFLSRNGKEMHVDFDMSGLDTSYIYDGEVVSIDQAKLSLTIYNKVVYNIQPNTFVAYDFGETSGLINKHSTDKKLIYNIFDIITDAPYVFRREELHRIDYSQKLSKQVLIHPVLKYFKTLDELEACQNILNDVTSLGGEGLMINLASATYLHKRTDQILKLKKVYTMDMKVYDVSYGEGKYEGMIGALEAVAKTDDGKTIICSVGTGLSDEQREEWSIDTSRIMGKTIEVSYFSLSQTKQDREYGTNIYSLRFPRLKRVRDDKDETSTD